MATERARRPDRRAAAVALALFAGGCLGADAGDPGGGLDGGAGADGGVPDALDCAALPPPAPDWLVGYQQELVARLAGAQPLPSGTTLTDRASLARRTAARDYLAAELSARGLEAQLHVYETGANIWAELPATTPTGRTLVLGAHYDTVPDSPGANDNATGVAIVMAAARHLQAVPCRATNVVFALFDQEEIGLVGSWHFARMLADQDTDVVAAHTFDQMGWDSDGDRAIELERPDPGLFELYADAVEDGGFDIPLRRTETGGTDHVSFRQVGYPAIGITEEFVSGDTTPYYHTPQDTYDTVDFGYLASTTTLVHFTLARHIAAAAP